MPRRAHDLQLGNPPPQLGANSHQLGLGLGESYTQSLELAAAHLDVGADPSQFCLHLAGVPAGRLTLGLAVALGREAFERPGV